MIVEFFPKKQKNKNKNCLFVTETQQNMYENRKQTKKTTNETKTNRFESILKLMSILKKFISTGGRTDSFPSFQDSRISKG